MNLQLIKLYQHVEVVSTSSDGESASPAAVRALNTAIAGLGYTFDRDLMKALLMSRATDFSLFMSELVDALTAISGSRYDYQVLFAKFPYEVPQDREYFLRRVASMVQHHVGYTKNYKLIACGHLIDPDLFDLADFGACPVCQFQIPGLRSPENVIADYQRLTPLKLLGLADPAWLTETANSLLARQSSLSMDERLFLMSRISQDDPPLTIPDKLFREQIPIAYLCADTNPRSPNRTFGEWDARYRLRETLLTTATDVLRVAVLLSDSQGDLSLKQPVRFKLRTSQIKDLLDRLNSIEDPEEDMLRWAERWKRLAMVLKPGTEKNRRNHPRAAEAFDKIMRRPKEVVTFDRVAERLLADNQIQDYAGLLAERPGEFLRKLDVMLRRTKSTAAILVPMQRAVKAAPTPLLFSLRKYLLHRADPSTGNETRVFRPKGQDNRIKVIDDTRPPVPRDALFGATGVIERELLDRLGRKNLPWKTVWIDPVLDLIPIPANRRGDSSTSRAVTKGMRWTLSPEAEVVRLFIWWKGNVDVDLSINLLDDDFEHVSHVGFTRLHGEGCYHSGDIVNAPDGAAEFIDVPLEYVRQHRATYAVMTVISYRGHAFSSFPCFAGYMERDAVKSGQRFEPESVAVKLDVAMDAAIAMPMIFDLPNRQMVYTDLSVGKRRYSGASRDGDKLAVVARAAMEQHKRSTTAGDVLRLAAEASASAVPSRQDAGVVWDVDNLDWDSVYALMD